MIPAQVCPYQFHTFLKHTDNASQSKMCPSSHLRQHFQSSRTLFRHLTSPSSLYPACFISSSPPAVRHTQDFPIVKYINKPTPQWSFPMTVFIYSYHLYFLITILMKPLVPKPPPTFWLLSLKHTSQFSFYLTAGEYLTISNAPSFLKALFLWLPLLSSLKYFCCEGLSLVSCTLPR